MKNGKVAETMTIETLVGNWGGFEKLVAQLHETGDVTVETNVVLPGRSGAPRQIDVLIRHRQGFHEHLVIVECKFLAKGVKRLHVDALVTTMREVGASRGVMFTNNSYQVGAVRQAKHENIDLFVVRDLTRQEWGISGRIFDMFLQFGQVGVGRIEMTGTYVLDRPDLQPDPDDVRLDLRIGHPEGNSVTPLLKPDGSAGSRTLEDHIVDGIQAGAKQAFGRSMLFNGGKEGTYFLGCPVRIEATEPLRIARKHGMFLVSALELPAALKITQSRITIDRAEQMEFALAVESKVTGDISVASRATGAALTRLRQAFDPATATVTDPLRNGQLVRVTLAGYFDIKEMDGLIPVLADTSRPFDYVDPNEE